MWGFVNIWIVINKCDPNQRYTQNTGADMKVIGSLLQTIRGVGARRHVASGEAALPPAGDHPTTDLSAAPPALSSIVLITHATTSSTPDFPLPQVSPESHGDERGSLPRQCRRRRPRGRAVSRDGEGPAPCSSASTVRLHAISAPPLLYYQFLIACTAHHVFDALPTRTTHSSSLKRM